ncbi:hypothetical protein P5673_019012 [Acropora cervicornis]|uniref:Uncharacterized protein n=1 Tax=Acropora cervicornis TaxID=6130 RepID=A0AAD9V2J4_ACRCE|nr:hypothetical protein P5673_019012 [Acropora cervicornis]
MKASISLFVESCVDKLEWKYCLSLLRCHQEMQKTYLTSSRTTSEYFTRLQVGAAACHSRLYKRTSKRHTFTVAYRRDGSPSIRYGQIEVFFKAGVRSKTSCGAVVVPMSKAKQDILLGIPVSHIIALHQPNRNIFVIVPLEDIIDVCAYMEFSDSRVNYAAHFPNHVEKD